MIRLVLVFGTVFMLSIIAAAGRRDISASTSELMRSNAQGVQRFDVGRHSRAYDQHRR